MPRATTSIRRLNRLQGLLTSSSLIWTATPLTTAKFSSNTSIDETTLPGVSGVLTKTYAVEVDHDFRRWLTGIGRFTWGTLDYQGDNRSDKIYSISGDLIYKMSRNLWLKGTLRRDWLDSNIPGNSTNSTVVMLGREAAALIGPISTSHFTAGQFTALLQNWPSSLRYPVFAALMNKFIGGI